MVRRGPGDAGDREETWKKEGWPYEMGAELLLTARQQERQKCEGSGAKDDAGYGKKEHANDPRRPPEKACASGPGDEAAADNECQKRQRNHDTQRSGSR